MSIGSNIVTILKAASDITDMVGAGDDARIRPNVLSYGTKLPALMYTVVDFESITTKDSYNDWDNYNVVIDCFDYTYNDAWALAEYVRTALERKTGTQDDKFFHTVIFNGFKDESSDEVSEGVSGEGSKIYVVSCDFNLIVK